MNQRIYWMVFAATQLFGSPSLATGSPHGNSLGLMLAMILLFPGSILGSLALDRLGIQFGYVSILASAFLVNIVCWYGLALGIRRIRAARTDARTDC